jgi:ATP-dependent DNA ligase
MLASKEKDNEITFPTFIQHKLNGVRALITLPRRDATVDDVIVYTRQRKLLPNMSALKKELFPYLQQLYQEVSIVLDGELYTHGKPLQEIVSKVRNESIEYEGDYHIFDCFYPDGKEDFEGRWDQIKNLFEVAEELKHTKMMYTKVVYNEQELRQEFKKAIQKDMEGLIVRDPKGLYLTSLKNPGSLRSKQVIKIKNKFSEEYEIVDFKSGTKGKDVGQVIWVIKVGENMIDVVQNIPAAERKRIYEECQKDFTKYKGKMLTVEFEEMSTEGKPLRARGIEIRDYE